MKFKNPKKSGVGALEELLIKKGVITEKELKDQRKAKK